MKKFLLIIIAAAGILAGCTNYKNIRLEDVQMEKFRMSALTSADVTLKLEVSNPTNATFEIIGAEGTIYKEGGEFARISQVDNADVFVAPGTPSETSITLRVSLTDPFAAVSAGFNPKSWDPSKFKADAVVWIRKGKMKKQFRFKDMPVKDLIEKLQ